MTAAVVDTDRLLSAQETMRKLGVSRAFLSVHAAEMGGVKIGRLLKFPEAAIREYITSNSLARPKPLPQAAPKPLPPRPRLHAVPSGINEVTGRPFNERLAR